MQFADLTLGEGEQAHAGKAQSLEEARDVLLVARQPIESFGDPMYATPGELVQLKA